MNSILQMRKMGTQSLNDFPKIHSELSSRAWIFYLGRRASAYLLEYYIMELNKRTPLNNALWGQMRDIGSIESPLAYKCLQQWVSAHIRPVFRKRQSFEPVEQIQLHV